MQVISILLFWNFYSSIILRHMNSQLIAASEQFYILNQNALEKNIWVSWGSIDKKKGYRGENQ